LYGLPITRHPRHPADSHWNKNNRNLKKHLSFFCGALSLSYRDHVIADFKDAFPRDVASLHNCRTIIDDKESEVLQAQDTMRAALQLLQEDEDGVTLSIQDHFSVLRRALATREEELLLRLQEIATRKRRVLEKQLDQLGEAMEACRICSTTVEGFLPTREKEYSTTTTTAEAAMAALRASGTTGSPPSGSALAAAAAAARAEEKRSEEELPSPDAEGMYLVAGASRIVARCEEVSRLADRAVAPPAVDSIVRLAIEKPQFNAILSELRPAFEMFPLLSFHLFSSCFAASLFFLAFTREKKSFSLVKSYASLPFNPTRTFVRFPLSSHLYLSMSGLLFCFLNYRCYRFPGGTSFA
jgi:hypothetical protein